MSLRKERGRGRGRRWQLVQELPNPQAQQEAPQINFGYFLSYSCGRLLVAALYGASDAYVYRRDGSGRQWTLEATLALPTPPTGGVFGTLLYGRRAFLSSFAGGVGGQKGQLAVYERRRGGAWDLVQTLAGFDTGPACSRICSAIPSRPAAARWPWEPRPTLARVPLGPCTFTDAAADGTR